MRAVGVPGGRGEAADRLIVALDLPDAPSALAVAEELRGLVRRVKVGMELYYGAGPRVLEELAGRGFAVFLDLKLHDIPNTVGSAMRVLGSAGAWMVNAHAAGGMAMLQAAREGLAAGAAAAGLPVPLLVAVTVLTSLDAEALAREVGIPRPPAEQVLRWARLAGEAGCDGVVASPHEIGPVKGALGQGFLVVTPGIRPAGGRAGDQRRVLTPAEAIRRGADYLVVGRPILSARDRRGAVRAILEEMEATAGMEGMEP